METPQTPERPRSRVLVIEDDETLSFLIREALENMGHEVTTATELAQGLACHRAAPADLIVLDRMFPGADSLRSLHDLRLAGDEVAVILLTSRSTVEDKVAGLREGADDYMGKPFAIAELQARVQALLRRTVKQPSVPAEISHEGPFTIHWVQMRVERDGRSLDLTPQEFRIMTLLIRAKGRPINRAELMANAWPSSSRPANLRTVDVYVARLRSKLGRASDPSWIRTQDGAGYAWND